MTLGERLAALERDVNLLRADVSGMDDKLDKALVHVHRSQGVRTAIMAVVAPIGGILGGVITTIFHGRT